jgi:hypothetical protein
VVASIYAEAKRPGINRPGEQVPAKEARAPRMSTLVWIAINLYFAFRAIDNGEAFWSAGFGGIVNLKRELAGQREWDEGDS